MGTFYNRIDRALRGVFLAFAPISDTHKGYQIGNVQLTTFVYSASEPGTNRYLHQASSVVLAVGERTLRLPWNSLTCQRRI